MKQYEGKREGTTLVLTVDGAPLNPRVDLLDCTRSEFDWGNTGNGSARLALCLLADCFGDDDEALDWYEDYMAAVVAGLPSSGWTLTEEDIQETVNAIANP
jgi:hypothetical protein